MLTQIDTLRYEAANFLLPIYFDDVSLDITVGEREPIDPDQAPTNPGAEVPQRLYAPGQTIIGQYCDDANARPQLGVTVVSIAASPYARADQDPAAALCAVPVGGGDLVGTYTYDESSSTITITATTSNGPWRSRAALNVPFVVNQSIYPVGAGETGTIYLKDAANYEATIPYTIPGTATGGIQVDTFTWEDGTLARIFYQAGPTRQLTFTNSDGNANKGVLSAAERGRASGALITAFCEGATRVEVRASLAKPYAVLKVLANSTECGYVEPAGPLTLERLTPFQPLPQQANGRVQVDTLGGALPVTVFVAGVTVQPEPVNADGFIEILGVPPGEHTAVIRDNEGEELSVDFTIPAPFVGGCTDPKATNRNQLATYEDGSCVYTPPVPAPVFQPPLLNPLRFVVPQAVDSCSQFETLDNVLFCQQSRPGHRVRPQYWQKVQHCDRLRLQVLTNYTAVEAVVQEHLSGTAVLTQAATQTVQLTGTAVPLLVQLSDNGDGRTRLRPADTILPENLLQSGRVTLSGGVSGAYLVRSRQKQASNGEEYLVLNRPWEEAGNALDIFVQWELLGPGYDVWQTTLDLSGLPEGRYQVRLRGSRAGWPDAEAVSEPLYLAEEHENTVVVEYKNTDNGYGMVWTPYAAGVLPRLRVEATFFRLKPAGTLNVHRNSNGAATVLASTAQRKTLLETYGLPDYLHEKLYLICRLDYLRVNGQRYTTDEVYQVAEQRASPLTGGAVALEQVEWLGVGNGHDAGLLPPPNANEYLLVNDEYLKVKV
ncbi:hypothetical protein [Hymenobacter algoricola]|uniref:IgGFc-binding protein N-terminal domain-containing protein n=1 Tax=Hymenobacter algoricola TaxID=486267 RepID=A0ABP7NAX8_9BACT